MLCSLQVVHRNVAHTHSYQAEREYPHRGNSHCHALGARDREHREQQIRKQQDKCDNHRACRADKQKCFPQYDINTLVVALTVEQADDRSHRVAAARNKHRDKGYGEVAHREHSHSVGARCSQYNAVEQDRLDEKQNCVDDRRDAAGTQLAEIPEILSLDRDKFQRPLFEENQIIQLHYKADHIARYRRQRRARGVHLEYSHVNQVHQEVDGVGNKQNICRKLRHSVHADNKHEVRHHDHKHRTEDIEQSVVLYVVIQRRVAAEHRGYRINQKYSQYRNYYRNQHRRREGQRKQSVRLAVVALSLRDGNAYRAADPEQEEERLHKKHNRLGEIYR